MPNPYASLPDYAFWRRSVAGIAAEDVDPVTSVPFTLSPQDKIATAGSCFAQHIARTLQRQGYLYLVTEPEPLTSGAVPENYGVFSARYANLYTTRQLLQLFERAYGLFEPADGVWARPDGAFVDPFRPQIQKSGFADVDSLMADQKAHLRSVRMLFETCDAFIFTLGLTESWMADADGAVVPLAPGVSGDSVGGSTYSFRNQTVPDMTADLLTFIDRLRVVNPQVRIILTVSPVSLVATYEKRHVLLSTIYSKSALRVVAETVSQERGDVAYFPSFEIITGHHHGYRFFEPDLRSVTEEGVRHVMSIFSKHYLGAEKTVKSTPARVRESRFKTDFERLEAVVCEEEALDS